MTAVAIRYFSILLGIIRLCMLSAYANQTDVYTSIPLHYDTGDILVPIKIGGRNLQFILDTGSSDTSIFKDVASGIAKQNGTKIKSEIFNGEMLASTLVSMPESYLGDLSIKNFPIAIINRFGPTYSKKIDGLLGGNILQYLVITIDYQSKKLILSEKSLTLSSGAFVIPFQLQSNVPYVEACFDGKSKQRAVIDTGSNCNYAPEGILEPLIIDRSVIQGIIKGNKRTENCNLARIRSLSLGPLTCDAPIFFLSPQKAHNDKHLKNDVVIIGNDLLSQFKLTLDYPNKQIIFEPYNTNESSVLHCAIEGTYYLASGNFQQAIEIFSRIITAEPGLAFDAYRNRAEAYVKLHNYQMAINDYNEVIKLNPKIADVYLDRAYAYQKLRQSNKVIEDCNTAIRINRNFTSAYLTRGLFYLSLDDYDHALSDFNNSIRLNSKNAVSYCVRGYTYEKLGRYRRALSDFNQAISLDPNFPDTYFHRAEYYENADDHQLALNDLLKAKELGYK